MGDKSIKNTNIKKKKKVDAKVSAPSVSIKSVVTQPELIRKKKKDI